MDWQAPIGLSAREKAGLATIRAMCNQVIAVQVPAASRAGYGAPFFAQITTTTTIKG
jgi:hypothetical protein